MENAPGKDVSRCSECQERLRNSVFCDLCGQPLCSWECFLRHTTAHARVRLSPGDSPSGPERGAVGEDPCSGEAPVTVAWRPV